MIAEDVLSRIPPGFCTKVGWWVVGRGISGFVQSVCVLVSQAGIF